MGQNTRPLCGGGSHSVRCARGAERLPDTPFTNSRGRVAGRGVRVLTLGICDYVTLRGNKGLGGCDRIRT